MSKKRKSTGSRARKKTLAERVREFNAKHNPHNLGTQLKPGETKIFASGTGFNTAAKKPAQKDNPELEKLSKDLGLTVQDINLLAGMFPPKNP